MQTPVIIFLDDAKPTEWYGPEAESARVFKNAQKCYNYCKLLPRIDVLYLDNDTGLDCKLQGSQMLERLVEFDNVEIGKVVIISLNGTAIQRIKAFCTHKDIPFEIPFLSSDKFITGCCMSASGVWQGDQ